MNIKEFVNVVETVPPEKEGAPLRYAVTLTAFFSPKEYKQLVDALQDDSSIEVLLKK